MEKLDHQQKRRGAGNQKLGKTKQMSVNEMVMEIHKRKNKLYGALEG